MKYIQHIIIIFAIMLTGVSFGQINLSDLNYVHIITPQQPVTIERLDLVGGDDEPAEKRHIQQVTYYDGLGREMQSIGIKHNKDSKDIVTHSQYDAYGRQARQYLPFKRNTANGTYEAVDIDQDINSYYHTQYANDFPGITDHRQINAYSETRFESSPLNRALEQGAPGSAWKIGSDSNTNHTVKSDWRYNTANEVVHFRVGFTANDTEKPTLIKVGYFVKNQVHVAIAKDENYSATQTLANEHTSKTYTNKQGQVVLTRTYAGTSVAGNAGGGPGAHDTYYVYDRFGNLTFVIPPKVDTTNGVSTIELNELCYQYIYDNRNRLIEKKIPGKSWEYIIYNTLDQPVLTQDALLKAESAWLFTKYDAYGRVAYTGKVTDNRDRKVIQTEFTAFNGELWVNRSSANNIGGVAMYYDNGGYPATQPIEVLTINYYDDYEFLGTNLDAKLANPGTVDGETIITSPKSLPTGSLVKVLETDSWITSVTYYDKKARPVYAATKNDYLSSIDVVTTQLDFTGKVKQSTSTHNKGSNAPIVTLDKMTYDHVGRPLVHTQTINGHEELITANQYDALGQLHYKNVGGVATGTGLQKVDYAYNIRGWLKTINEGKTDNGDLFGFALHYAQPKHGGTALYNGNIAETQWQTANDHTQRWYTYSYDAMNRITGAISNDGKYNLSNVTYDKMGNIETLSRNGFQNTATFTEMDKLTYNYDDGNKLLRVTDTGNKAYGFKDGVNANDDFEYDENGNMIVDRNKGITEIEYNHLSLPTKVNVIGREEGRIEYVYDATGAKLKKIVTENGQPFTTEYAGSHIYTNGNLEFFSMAEGYVEPNSNNGFDYVYQYADTRGNIRLSYTDANKDGSITVDEIFEENDYYPFGLKHQKLNPIVSSLSNHIAKKFKYNGVEQEDALGIDLYEMEVRSYDPAIARFTGIDPVTHHSMSTYTAFDNNPVYWSDPSGADAYSDDEGSTSPGEAKNNALFTVQGQAAINGFKEVQRQAENEDNGGEKGKKKEVNKESSTGRRGARQRGRNRSRFGSGSLIFDARGQELLSHWLDGSGKNLELDSEKWQDYMKDNETLGLYIKGELQEVLNGVRDKIKKLGKTSFKRTFHGEMENGYMTGYEMLHGSHRALGDTQIMGTVEYNSSNNQFDFNIQVIWNDKIDPNPTYGADIKLSNFLNTFYSPKDYDVKIKWNDKISIK